MVRSGPFGVACAVVGLPWRRRRTGIPFPATRSRWREDPRRKRLERQSMRYRQEI